MPTSFCKDIYEMLCKKYPNKKIYVISDQHFYHHNIIRYTRNHFSDVTQMNQYIIRKHNEIVGEEDIVIFLGDFCFKNSFIRELVNTMHGHKYLVLGNHDSENLVRNYPLLGFEGVFTTPVKIQNDYLSHVPLIDEENSDLSFSLILNEFKKQASSINYHGHIHTSVDISPSYKNVTCESLDYKPFMIGKTKKIEKENMFPFIESNYFDKILTTIKNRHNIDPSILLGDYIYSSILENSYPYYNQYFIQGSFGLLKKYDFLSKFSDLDISFLYDSTMSKRKNISLLKNMVDSSYEFLKRLDRVNLRFLKRYSSLCILEALYTSKYPYFTSCYLDANMICLDCYKETDFLSLEGTSLIEKFLAKEDLFLLTEYDFPHFQTKTLKLEGDIANLVLQVLFQRGYEDRRIVALRKLQYVYGHNCKNKNIEDFSSLFTRFFLRNVSLLFSLNRLDEIAYIQEKPYHLSSIFPYLDNDLQTLIYDAIYSPNSPFGDIYKEICSIPTKEAFTFCKQKVKSLK